MARPKTNTERTYIRVDRDVIARVETILMDPIKGRLRYGALKTLVTVLLRQWLQQFDSAPDKIAFLKAYGIDLENNK